MEVRREPRHPASAAVLKVSRSVDTFLKPMPEGAGQRLARGALHPGKGMQHAEKPLPSGLRNLFGLGPEPGVAAGHSLTPRRQLPGGTPSTHLRVGLLRTAGYCRSPLE